MNRLRGDVFGDELKDESKVKFSELMQVLTTLWHMWRVKCV